MQLRAARSTDAGKVGTILSDFAAHTEWFPNLHTGAEDIAHAGQMIARGWVHIALAQGVVAGFSACHEDEVNALYVAQDMQRQGVGTMLVQELQRTHPRLSLWTFQANTAARQFYARHGFVEGQMTDGAGTDEKLPDIRLTWQKDHA